MYVFRRLRNGAAVFFVCTHARFFLMFEEIKLCKFLSGAAKILKSRWLSSNRFDVQST